jgi:hypothetical protein
MKPVLACVAFCLASIADAQEAPGKPNLESKQALLTKACAAMAELRSGAFTTEEWSDSPMARAARGAVGAAADARERVSGAWSGELLSASFDGGADEALWSGRRMVARTLGGGWKLRRDTMEDGRTLPHVLDPSTVFTALARSKLEVMHSEVGAFEDRPVEILTVHVEGVVARELRLAGVLPDGSDAAGGGMMVFAGRVGAFGGRKGVAPQVDVEADLAFFIDPATQHVHQLRIRSYTKSGAMAVRVFVAAGGATPAGEEEEEEDEADPKAPLQFKSGLPVRKVKKDQTSVCTYEIKMKDHGKATLPELDASARELLGIGATK